MLNGYFEYAVDANSIAVPFADSKNLGAATVIGQTSRGGSHGPTNDGRVKPDLSTKTSPSASPTAQAAGAAAVVRSALGEMKPWQLVQYFRNYTTIVAGTEYHPTTEPTVPSNNVGYGYVSLRGNGPPRTPLAPSKILASSFRLFDSRIATGKRTSTAPLPPNSAYSIEFGDQVGLGPNGGYPQTLLLNITRWFAARGESLKLAAAPVALPGGEKIKNDFSQLEASGRMSSRWGQ